MTTREIFARYESAVARDRAGYAYRGYMVREINGAWDPQWTVTKAGHHITTCCTRDDAHAAIDMIAEN